MVTLKSSSDSEWPLGVISGFSISNFNLGCMDKCEERAMAYFLSFLSLSFLSLSQMTAWRLDVPLFLIYLSKIKSV